MKDSYSKKLIEKYINYMKKNSVVISVSEAKLDLESFSTVFLSFALAEKNQK